MVALERDAALGRPVAGARRVHEDGAAGATHPRPDVVAQHHDKIVKSVGAPEVLRAGRIGVTHRPIVIAVCRGVAPAIAKEDSPNGQPRSRAAYTVRTVEDGQNAPAADGCGPVSLALTRPAPAAAKRAGKGKSAELNETPRPCRRQAHDEDRLPTPPVARGTRLTGTPGHG